MCNVCLCRLSAVSVPSQLFASSSSFDLRFAFSSFVRHCNGLMFCGRFRHPLRPKLARVRGVISLEKDRGTMVSAIVVWISLANQWTHTESISFSCSVLYNALKASSDAQ